MCKCMCRRCTSLDTYSVGTQTEWVTYVKAVQVRPKLQNKSVMMKPECENSCTEAALPMADAGVDPWHSDHEDDDEDSDSGTSPNIDAATCDPDYLPSDSSGDEAVEAPVLHPPMSPNKPNRPPADEDTKFLVFQSCLMELFRKCPKCGSSTVTVSYKTIGSLLRVNYSCTNSHKSEWLSQPLLKDSMGAGNLLLSAAILVTGSTYDRFREISDVLHMPIMCGSYFYQLQEKYLLPAIHSVYVSVTQKESLIAAFAGDPVTLIGDGRCDSPGFSAKYGTYSVMEIGSGALLTFTLGQVSPEASVGLEVEGCYDALKELLDLGVNCSIFGTDCSTSVGKLLRQCFPNIIHEHDVYHIEKRIRKKLFAKANQRGNTIMYEWIKPLINHLWWACQNCNHNPIELREKWISCIYHITDKHTWDNFEVYHRCPHPTLPPEVRRKKKWLKPGSQPHEAIKAVVMDSTLFRDIEKLTYAVHTGALETFHSLLGKYCPKRQSFSYKGMLIRTELAVLDHNSNCERKQATRTDGEPQFKIVCPKRTKEWIPKPIMGGKSHNWRLNIAKQVLKLKNGNAEKINIPVPENLPANIADTPRPSKEEILQKHRSRFAGREQSSEGSDSE